MESQPPASCILRALFNDSSDIVTACYILSRQCQYLTQVSDLALELSDRNSEVHRFFRLRAAPRNHYFGEYLMHLRFFSNAISTSPSPKCPSHATLSILTPVLRSPVNCVLLTCIPLSYSGSYNTGKRDKRWMTCTAVYDVLCVFWAFDSLKNLFFPQKKQGS
jgi:hypothetical protein